MIPSDNLENGDKKSIWHIATCADGNVLWIISIFNKIFNLKILNWVLSHAAAVPHRLHARFTNMQRTSNFTYIYLISRIASSTCSIKKKKYVCTSRVTTETTQPSTLIFVSLIFFVLLKHNKWNNFYFTEKRIQTHRIHTG